MLENPALTLIVLLLTIALNVVLIVKIPKGFFPQQDTGVIVGGVQGPQDASFPPMNDSVRQIGERHQERSRRGQRHRLHRRPRRHEQRLHLHRPQAARASARASAEQIINRLRPKMNRLPVASAFLQAAQDLRIGGRASNALYQYTIQSDNVAGSGASGARFC